MNDRGGNRLLQRQKRTIPLLLPFWNGIQSLAITTLHLLTIGTLDDGFIGGNVLEKDMFPTSFCRADGTIELTAFHSTTLTTTSVVVVVDDVRSIVFPESIFRQDRRRCKKIVVDTVVPMDLVPILVISLLPLPISIGI